MTLVFLDDAAARDFAPFSLTRPACELRAGAELVRRRWEMALSDTTAGFVSAPHLDDFEEPGAPSAATGVLRAGTVVVNARCAVSLAAAYGECDVWRCDGRVAAVRLAADTGVEELRAVTALEELTSAAGRATEVDGWWMEHVWDLVRHLPAMLTADIPLLASSLDCVEADLAIVGGGRVFLERGALVEPMVVVDASGGPVLVRRGATVAAFTRLAGPCYVGVDSAVLGGRVAASAIGDVCRVHGELSVSILTGHANKGHDGFIGHSVLGRWVNLGASTVNSNLKNTYGSVALWTPEGTTETGMQFLGTFFGDHAKTAIGTRLTTGCVVGAGANVLGGGTAPKLVPPFAWGDSGEKWALDRFLETAARMMQRRHVTLGDRARRQLTAAWHLGAGVRR